MRHRWFAACLLFSGGGLAAAQEQEEVETVDAIRSDFYSLLRARSQQQPQQSPTEDEILALVERCWKLHDLSDGEPAQFDALRTILMIAEYRVPKATKLEPEWSAAAGKLFTEHVDDDRMAEVALGLRSPPALKALLDSYLADVKAKSTNPNVRAAFDYKDVRAALSELDSGRAVEGAEKAVFAKLDKLAADHGDATVPYEGVTYRQFAADKRWALENLKVGAPAPEITGPDLDGVEFDLSDYRGKVVLLDFWGYW